MADPTGMDAIANISITLFGNGAMQTSGNIADVKLALAMLDHAKDAINNKAKREAKKLIIPSRDVEVKPSDAYPLTQNADVAPELRMKHEVQPMPELTGMLRTTASPYKEGPYTRLVG